MSYDVKEFKGEPIVLVTMNEDFDPAHDTADSIERLTPFFDAQTAPIFYAVDIRSIRFDFGDVVSMMGMATKGNATFLRHPNIRELVIITSSEMITLGAKALGQSQYGGLNVSVFGSPEEAFGYMREQAAAY